jgi:DNA-binding LacI/PurR family transcriptional regulator
MQKPVSIKDIAEAAGVSPSTVSRALHDHPRISEQMAKRIRQLARQMGYSPSVPARSLVTRHTSTIGLVISHVSDPFLGRLVNGVEEAARVEGYSVFLSSSYRNADLEANIIRDFFERRVTGVVVSSSQINNGYFELRKRYPLPFVLINFQEYPHSVSTDNLAGAQQAVEHLVQLGHRRIAYVSNHHIYPTDLHRRAGYKATLRKYEILVDDALVIEGDGTLEGGVRAMRQLLALPVPPTAIFCYNDVTAMGVMRGIYAAGRQVPHDFSVIGFDDLDLAAYYCPPLTTVHQPCYRLGKRAMRMLLRLIQGGEDVEAEVLPAELVLRETSGPPSVPAN